MIFWANVFREVMRIPEPASTYASSVDELHAFVLLTTMAGSAAVSLFTLVAVARFRARPPFPPVKGKPKTWLEAVLIGATLGLFLLWWGLGFRLWATMDDPPDDAEEVYVIAKQWMWKFVYPDGRSSIGELVVPAGRPVRLVMTSRDVIHSFYVPAMRIKRDVVPGQSSLAWFEASHPGRFPVRCAEFCGMDHSKMLGEVVALDPDDYARWLDESDDREGPAPLDGGQDLADRGRQVAQDKGCVRCHTFDGTPHLGPTWLGLFGSTVPLAGGGSVVADEPYLTRSMMDPQVQIHDGYSPIMPSFRGKLDAEEAAALVELIRSLRHPPEPPSPPLPEPSP